jgi:hypothetical protein
MKTLRLNIIALLLMLPCLAAAGEGHKGKYTKEKKISKTYIVNADAALNINNQFGSVYVTTWDENQTSIEIVIKVSGNDEAKVDKRLASINVDLEATKSLVSAHTSIGNMSGNNLSMEINYTVKIPKKGSIDLDNQYGPIITGKIYGKSNIECQYGDVAIDELNNESNIIDLQYSGVSKANYIKNATIDAQYSGLSIAKGGNIKLKSQYTGTTIGEAVNIEYNTEYGDLNVKSAKNVIGTGDYSDLKFGHISGNFNATCNYGELKISRLDNTAKNVAINASYTNIDVLYEDGYVFDFEFYLEYGNLRGTHGFKFTENSNRDNEGRYKGYSGRSGVNRMYIKSEFGDINLGKS